MITIEDVEKFCRSLSIGYDANVERDEDEVRISIRDGVDDEPSQNAIIEARHTMDAIRKQFGAEVKVGSEYIDEWVDVTIKIK